MNMVGGPHDPQDGPKSEVGKPGCTRSLAPGPRAVRRRSAERPCGLDQCRKRPTLNVQVSALLRSIRAGQRRCRNHVGDDVSIHQTATTCRLRWLASTRRGPFSGLRPLSRRSEPSVGDEGTDVGCSTAGCSGRRTGSLYPIRHRTAAQHRPRFSRGSVGGRPRRRAARRSP